jgi:release factor glutamine methyltransferase
VAIYSDSLGGQLTADTFAQSFMTIRDFMRGLLVANVPRNEARLLLARVLHRDPAWLVAHDDYEFTANEFAQINALTARRAAGEPIAYLLGEREFYGRTFRCSPAALIPRPETELLIDRALLRLPANAPLRVLDVGTGTGCIAITLALERPHTRVAAIDISTDALALARDNVQRLGAVVAFIESSWFAAFDATPPSAQFDVIVSNPPYIVPGDAHLTQGDLRFEPAIALADAVDGLESYRQLARGAMQHLRSNGALIVEHGYDQGESVPALFAAAGFVDVTTHRDLAGHPRVTEARKAR